MSASRFRSVGLTVAGANMSASTAVDKKREALAAKQMAEAAVPGKNRKQKKNALKVFANANIAAKIMLGESAMKENKYDEAREHFHSAAREAVPGTDGGPPGNSDWGSVASFENGANGLDQVPQQPPPSQMVSGPPPSTPAFGSSEQGSLFGDVYPGPGMMGGASPMNGAAMGGTPLLPGPQAPSIDPQRFEQLETAIFDVSRKRYAQLTKELRSITARMPCASLCKTKLTAVALRGCGVYAAARWVSIQYTLPY